MSALKYLILGAFLAGTCLTLAATHLDKREPLETGTMTVIALGAAYRGKGQYDRIKERMPNLDV